MDAQYRLVTLANSELVAGLSALVRQNNLLTGQLLAHLVELEQRMLHLELGFSSLFSYCVEALGMSEGAAGRRVAAARVCRRFPEVFEGVARGDVHLCALCALAPHLTVENANELFEACRGKTRRQIEELLAVRFPRADVRDQVRRLPAQTQTAAVRGPAVVRTQTNDDSILPQTSCEHSPEIEGQAQVLPNRSPSQADQPVPDLNPRRRELEPLSVDRYGVHFTADAELRNLLERARALASHRLPKGDLAGLVRLMAETFVRQEEKRRFGVGTTPRRVKIEANPSSVTESRNAERRAPPGALVGVSASSRAAEPAPRDARALPVTKRGRYVPVTVRREAHTRDLGQCAFVSADGRRCNAVAFLEFDHLQPFARFGAADALNIRLLCRAHNLLHARNCFGAMHVAAKIAAKKRLGPQLK